ncbi:MAG: ABC transporter substrate-binding protein [Dehalococcoidia bacterium]
MKAAAREEGRLVLASGNNSSRALTPPIRDAFGKQFGIQVTVAGGRGSEQFARIGAERQGGRYEIDLLILGRRHMGESFGPAGFLTPIQDQLFHPDALDTSKWWGERLWFREPEGVEPKYSVAFSVSAYPNPLTPSYNTELVTEADIAAINSAWDFLDLKWKDKIIALSPLATGISSGLIDIYAHPALGPAWIERFFSRELDVTFAADDRQIVDSISFGGHALAVFGQGAEGALVALAREGLPVARWSKNLQEGGRLSANSSYVWLGMLDRAPHPNAAKLFVNWWLTQEGQTAYNTLSATTDLPPSLREDVPVGISDPLAQRVPGAEYDMSSLDTSLPDNRAEAIEFAQRVFLEGREGSFE